MGEILAEADSIITEATKIAARQMDSDRSEANSIQRVMADLDAQSRSLAGLMMNPAIDTGALTAFSRQISEKENERKKLQLRLERVGMAAAQGHERLGRAVRKAYGVAREHFTNITSNESYDQKLWMVTAQ